MTEKTNVHQNLSTLSIVYDWAKLECEAFGEWVWSIQRELGVNLDSGKNCWKPDVLIERRFGRVPQRLVRPGCSWFLRILSAGCPLGPYSVFCFSAFLASSLDEAVTLEKEDPPIFHQIGVCVRIRVADGRLLTIWQVRVSSSSRGFIA